MAIESVSLFELLDRGERFKLFAESVLGKGWVSDEELHLTRVAFRYAPEGDEFKPLVRKYGFDEVCELSLQSTAFRQNSGDFLYLFYDAMRFADSKELRVALRNDGIDVSD
ncbi:hypothetical protein [Burkholderia sola]